MTRTISSISQPEASILLELADLPNDPTPVIRARLRSTACAALLEQRHFRLGAEKNINAEADQQADGGEHHPHRREHAFALAERGLEHQQQRFDRHRDQDRGDEARDGAARGAVAEDILVHEYFFFEDGFAEVEHRQSEG